MNRRLSSSALAAALVAVVACSSPSKGGLVLAISTDMQTPKDVNIVSVFVTIDSVVKFDYLGRVLPDGTVELPATLAIVEQANPNAQVRIRVIAFKEQSARVLRDVLTTVPHERTSLLRVPLGFLDDGSGTGTLPSNLVPLAPGGAGAPEGDTTFDPDEIASSCDFSQQQTSINGVCASALVASADLPSYDPAAVYGAGGLQSSGSPSSCFAVPTCFAQATPVTGLDATACQFTLGAATQDPGVVAVSDAGASGGGGSAAGPDQATSAADASVKVQDSPAAGAALELNVALVTPDTGACIAPGRCFVPLTNDASSGWTLVGNTVTLVPGICAKVKAGATLAIAQGTCPSKQLSDAVCEPVTGSGITSGGGSGSDPGSPVVDGGFGNGGTTSDAGFVGKGVTCGPTACSVNEVCCVGTGSDAKTTFCAPQGGCATRVVPDSGTPVGPADAGTAGCVPLTGCSLMNYDCGFAPDGCGGVMTCGTCNGPDYCGGGGFDRCGSVGGDAGASSCVPSSCTDQNIGCGQTGDGCGGVLDCGTCTDPQTCGGGGVPSQCGGGLK